MNTIMFLWTNTLSVGAKLTSSVFLHRIVQGEQETLSEQKKLIRGTATSVISSCRV